MKREKKKRRVEERRMIKDDREGLDDTAGLHVFKTELCRRGSISLVDHHVRSGEGEEGV